MFLQNAIALTKCEIRMQNASCFLLQNAIVLLQIEAVITKWVGNANWFGLCHKIPRKRLTMLFQCLNVQTLF